MNAFVTRRSDWSPSRLLPSASLLVCAVISVLPLRFPDYAAVAPLLVFGAVYHWTIYRPELVPPIALFAAGVILDLLDGGPLGVSSLLLLLTRATLLPQRRFFVNRLFPFMWMGFTVLAAAAGLFLWLLGSAIDGTLRDPRAAMMQWVLTVACFPVVGYLLMRVQRAWILAA